MVLKSSDLGGASISAQGYYRDSDFPSVISYKREFQNGRSAGVAFLDLENDAEIGRSAGSTRSFFATVRRLFGSKGGRALLKKSFRESLGGNLLVSDLRIGHLVALGVGDDSFDLPMTVRLLGVKTEIHFSVFRVERVLCTFTIVGAPGGHVARTGIVRLARVVVARTHTQLTPKNTVLPAVSGTAQVGQILTASTGTWTGGPTSFTYQWQRCDATGANCADIPGATAQTYVLTQDDVGSTVRVVVTAQNALGSASVPSSPTPVVSAVGAPTNTTPPAITGTAQQGQTLTASTGTWTGNPTSFAFQWQRCDSAGNTCSVIAGANGGTYVVGAGDVGSTLRVAVTATNAVGSATVVSAQTPVVG